MTSICEQRCRVHVQGSNAFGTGQNNVGIQPNERYPTSTVALGSLVCFVLSVMFGTYLRPAVPSVSPQHRGRGRDRRVSVCEKWSANVRGHGHLRDCAGECARKHSSHGPWCWCQMTAE